MPLWLFELILALLPLLAVGVVYTGCTACCGGPPVTTPCCGGTVPVILYGQTVSSCADLNGLTCVLTYDPVSMTWKGTIPFANGNLQPELQCQGVSAGEFEMFGNADTDAAQCIARFSVRPDDGAACGPPLFLSYTGVNTPWQTSQQIGGCVCDNNVTIGIQIMS